MRPLALAFLALVATQARAAPPRDPVGAEMSACLERSENQTTSGMSSCMIQAVAGYDRLLETRFQAVIGKLDPASRDLVRAAQRQWTVYRRAEEQAQSGPWRDQAGPIAGIAALSSDVDMVKQRIDQLGIYLEGR